MSSSAFIIQVTPLLQGESFLETISINLFTKQFSFTDNNTIDVKVIIGSSSLMLLIFIFAAVLVVSITIW